MSSYRQFSKTWEDLEFSDNYIFCKVMENTELCKKLLEILLHIKIHHLEQPVSEQTILPEYKAKGVRMDAYVQDSNKVFNIEMQVGNYMDLLQRNAYYQVDMNLGNITKTKCNEQKESYVIFICKDDPFNIGCKNSKECSEYDYQNTSHFMVYNLSAYEKEDDEELKSVLKFIYGLKAETPFTNELETAFNEIKQNQSLENLYMDFFDYIEEEKDEAALEASVKIVYAMLKDDVPIPKIVKYTNLESEVIEDMIKEVAE